MSNISASAETLEALQLFQEYVGQLNDALLGAVQSLAQDNFAGEDGQPSGDRRCGHPWRLVEARRKETVEEYVAGLPDYWFSRLFRINKAMFNDVVSRLKRRPEFANSRTPIERKVLVAIARIAHVHTVPQLVFHFGIGAGSCTEVCDAVWQAIIDEYHATYVAALRPDTEAKRAEIAAGMAARTRGRLHHCIGAVDCSHHRIRKPSLANLTRSEADSYWNHKDGISIRFQAISNHLKQIYSFRYGFAGSTNDNVALQYSTAWQTRDNWIPAPWYLAGDGGYGLSAVLVTPFTNRDSLDGIATKFNYYFSSMRTVVEQSFGLFKGRFRAFAGILVLDTLERYNRAFTAAIVLHNWCIAESVAIDLEISADMGRLLEREAAEKEAIRAQLDAAPAAAAAAPDSRDSLSAGKLRRVELMAGAGLVSTPAQRARYNVD